MAIIKGFTKAKRVNAKRLLIYSKPKVGKTEAFTKLDNHLIIDADGSGGYYDGNFARVVTLKDWVQLKKEVVANKYRFEYGVLDTITEGVNAFINELCVDQFNKDQITMGEKGFVPHDVTKFNITHLAYGRGYGYLREKTVEVINDMCKFCRYVIISAHVADKASNSSGAELTIKEVDLPGKLKNSLGLKVDAIGLLYRDPNDDKINKISFIHHDSVMGGTRAKHLRDEVIEFSELQENGELKVNWDKIYKTNQ